MNITPEQYYDYRINQRLTDADIVELYKYSRTSVNVLTRWKKENNIPAGRAITTLLNKDVIRQELRTHSMVDLARKYNVSYSAFKRYVKTLY